MYVLFTPGLALIVDQISRIIPIAHPFHNNKTYKHKTEPFSLVLLVRPL